MRSTDGESGRVGRRGRGVARLAGCIALALCALSGCREPFETPQPWSFELDAGAAADSSAEVVSSARCETSAPAPCAALSEQVWPVAADTPLCTDSDGERHETTGEGAATWFHYGGCGSIKEYEVERCSWVRIVSHGDSCESCTLWHVDYAVEHRRGKAWERTAAFDPPDRRGMSHEACVQIPSSRFRIRGRDGFYVKVFTR